MISYFCPYCSKVYQLNSKTVEGKMICVCCGEELVERTLLKSSQMIAIITALAFVTPLIVMIFSLINELKLPKYKRLPQSNKVVLSIIKSLGSYKISRSIQAPDFKYLSILS